MKSKTIFAILLLFTLWISGILADDTCPTGMRKTYLDDTTATPHGTARSFIPALNFYEGNGALWFNRKVLLEPRMEVHLKVNVEPVDVMEDSVEQEIEGFTIVLSKTKNTVGSGTGEYIGYYGFTQSYVMEFDFSKDSYDPDASSYSFKYCESSCSSDDSGAIYSGKLSNQKFDATKTMNWDFRLIYADQVLKVYSGANEVLFSYSVDLSEKFDSNIGFVGFTGYMRGNRRELNLLGTFICEDNYDLSQMVGRFYINEVEYDTAVYKAGSKINYLFSFINNKGQVIPHCFKAGIWSYDFKLNIDCSSNSGISVKDDYDLYLYFDACTTVGKHQIGISEVSHGNGPIKYYTIIAGDLTSIKLVGHDGVIGTFTTETDSSGVIYLKYGTLSGDFALSSSSLVITLDFQMTDTYGNVVDLGEESSTMLTNSQMSLANSNGAILSMKKNGNYYQLIITISKIGTYQINKNSYMTASYKIIVTSGSVDTTKSICTIENASSTPTLNQGDTVTYNCYFKDSAGNAISIANFLKLSEYEFSAIAKKTSGTTKEFTPTITDKGDHYACTFTVSELGDYTFTGYLTKKGSSTKTAMSSTISNFKVLASATGTSLKNSYFYSTYTKQWTKLDSTTSFNYQADSNGLLCYLDLTDADEQTLISTCGKYPSDFDVSKVTAKLTSSHDSSYTFKDLTAKIVTVDGKQYVGIYTSGSTDNTVLRSSFDYTLTVTYKNVVKTLTLKYKFDSPYTIGDYTTCFHKLDESSTVVDVKDFTGTQGSSTLVGTIELRTIDGYLYNHDIGTGNIQIVSKNDNNRCNFEIKKDTVLGRYLIYANPWGSIDNDYVIKVNNVEVGGFHGTAGSAYARYIEFVDSGLFEEVGTNKDSWTRRFKYIGDSEGYLTFKFKLYDEKNNLLTSDSLSGLKLAISSEQKGSDTKYYECTYDANTQTWTFKDKIDVNYGQYTWKFVVQDTWHDFYITYIKQGEVTVDASKSTYTLKQDSLYTGETGYIDVTLKDNYGVNIATYDGELAANKDKVTVECTTSSGKKCNWTYDSTTSTGYRFKNTFDTNEEYTIVVKYNGQVISTSTTNNSKITVKTEEVSTDNSKFYIMLNGDVELTTGSTIDVDNSSQIPKLKIDLYNDEGSKLTNTKDLTITATMTGSNGKTYDLTTTSTGNSLIYTFDQDTQDQFNLLEKGTYTLTVIINGEKKTYTLNILGDESSLGASALKDFDISKTSLSNIIIKSEAGVTNYVNGQFNAADSLRWNYEVNTGLFSCKNSLNLGSQDLTVTFGKGAKRGQFIIYINQKKATTGGDNNILTCSYNSKTIPSTITLIIYASSLSYFEYVDGCQNGTVVDLPVIRVIPRDQYGNLYTDLFDSSKTNQATLNSLTVGKSTDGVSLTANNYVTDNKYLNVEYKTKTATNIVVTSSYISGYECKIRIGSGEISLSDTYSEVKSTGSLEAGGKYNLMIYPKDVYGNDIDGLDDSMKNKFTVKYEVIGITNGKVETSQNDCALVEGYTSTIEVIPSEGQSSVITHTSDDDVVYNSIQCSIPISVAGSVQFYVYYNGEEVRCSACLIVLRQNNLDVSKTITVYTNTDTTLSETKTTNVDVQTTSKFQLTFYDQYENIITDSITVSELATTAEFIGADIKLCVSNSNNHKVITVCPSSNGDDNLNKWSYLTNGDYKIKVNVDGTTFTYLITITGGYTDGSSAAADFSKTVITPSDLILNAGEEGTVNLEIRTSENERKNYWYPNIADVIKLNFSQDSDTCKYSVTKGEKPGQYVIKFTCTKSTNSNSFSTTVEDTTLKQKVNFVINTGNCYYLELLDTDLFNASGQRYTWKNKLVNGEDVSFNFKLLDQYKNYIQKTSYKDAKASVNSETYGTDATKFDITYNTKTGSYLFKDNIDEIISKHTWDIICDTNQNKYYFTYTKVAGEIDTDKSSWTIDKNVYKFKDTSTVEITLRDSFGVNVGEMANRLNTEKDNLSVIAKGEDGTTLNYEFEQVTAQNTLIFKKTQELAGKFEVIVTYNKKEIKDNQNIVVNYEEYALDKNHLYALIGNSQTEVYTTTTTNINNLENNVEYKYMFYTIDGKQITDYDKNTKIEAKMTRDSYTYQLDVSKEDGYVSFTYRDDYEKKFNELPSGDYNLVVTVDGKETTYKLHLLGEAGSEDASPSSSYDLSKTSINTTKINGVAGETYAVAVELRASDGLRWNYEVPLNDITVTTTYPQNSKTIVFDKELGEKKGQFILYITQYKATTGQDDNIVTVSVDGKNIAKQIDLNIKCADLDNLKYDSGYRNGTVVDLPVIKFIPEDKYGNLYTDLFDTSKTTQKDLNELTKATTSNDATLTTNNYVSDNKYLNVQYLTTQTTTATVTSDKLDDKYTYEIGPGPIDADTSYAQLTTKDVNTAGDTYELKIYPKDEFGNNITKLTNEDLAKFDVYYEVGNEKKDISKTCTLTGHKKIVNGKETVESDIICTVTVNEAGTIDYHVEYNNREITCKDCTIYINADKIDMDKTTVTYKNTGEELKTDKKNEVEISVLPTFEITFHDQYGNVVTNEEEVKNKKITTELDGSDVKFCVADNGNTKLATVCEPTNGDDNVNRWYYSVNGDDYYFIVKEDKTTNTQKYQLDLVGGYKEGSSDEINESKTEIKPSKLTLTAGEKGRVTIELKTDDEERKNYWFTDANEHIDVAFEKNADSCTYTIDKAEKPGQYYLNLMCTKKEDSNKVTVTIDGEKVEDQVDLKIVPGPPASSILYDMKDNKITNTNLGEVSVEDKFQMKEVLFDKYGNQITEPNFQTSELGITFAPKEQQRVGTTSNSNSNIQTNGEVLITLTSTMAGEHQVNGTYFPEDSYSITFTHGQVSSENSVVDVEKSEVTAGENSKTYITAYDKYNNYIDANEFKDENPFTVYTTYDGSNTKKTLTDYTIDKFNGKNVIAYDTTYEKAGISHSHAQIDNEPASCSSCVVTVNEGNVNFQNNEYKRFDSNTNKYQIIQDHIVENNAVEEPIYRVYPKDSYGNAIEYIPEEKLKTYKCKLVSQKEDVTYEFKLNNEDYKNQAYAEFVINDVEGADVTYATLVGGFYDLVFSDDEGKVVYNITLAGTKGDEDASNTPVDVQNTHINSNDLEFVAGETGNLYIELRTEDNLRKNYWEGYEFEIESCDKTDDTFKYKQEKAGTLGVFYITVTTEKANTYPKYEGCKLTIKVNGEVVKKLQPEMKVHPATIDRTEILTTYYKDKSKNLLKDGTADSNYAFEVQSFDKYDNLCETDQSVVGIKVLYNAEEVKSTSDNNDATGNRKYNAQTSTAGKYTVTSDLNRSKGVNYLREDAYFNIGAGEIDLSKTVMNVVNPVIKAGEKPAISVLCFDKNGNSISGNTFVDKFDVTFKDAKSEKHESSGAVDSDDSNKVIYTSKTPVTIVGNVNTDVVYGNSNKLDSSDLVIKVVAAEPDPMNSILTRETSKGVFTTYKNGDSFTVNTNNLLVLNVTLYDTYGNYIAEIPYGCDIKNPLLSGNDMEEIEFDVTNLKSYFNMDYNNDENAIHTYTHLVSGTYDLTYTVETPLGKADFKYGVIIVTNRDDSGHGNGPFSVAHCVLKPKEATFYAGDYQKLTLEFRTEKDLLYNDDVDIDDIKIAITREDKSFTSEVTKDGNTYGIYTITIYSERKGKFDLSVNLFDKKANERQDVGPSHLTVLPGLIPYRPYTDLYTVPEPQITADSTIEITFTLADKFDNGFEDRYDIIDNKWLYVVVNGDNIVTEATKELLDDGETFRVTLPAQYPPNEMHINVIYNDGTNTVICFPEDVVTEIITEPDFTLTKVESRNAQTIWVGDILDMQLYLFDSKGYCIENVDYSDIFQVEVYGELSQTPNNVKSYSVRKVNDDTLSCQNKYEIITTEDDKYTVAGDYFIKVLGGATTVATFNQKCYALGYNLNGFYLDYVDPNFDPDHVLVSDTISFVISGKDIYGNTVTDPLIDDMTIDFTFTEDGTQTNFEHDKSEASSGKLRFDVNIHKIGPHQLHLYYKGEEVLTVNDGEPLPIFTIIHGPCRAENNDNFYLDTLKDVLVNEPTYFRFQCYDEYGNKITEGGEHFTPTGTLIVGETQTTFDTTVVDNGDGTYDVKCRPPLAGTYIIGLVVDDNIKYGENVQFEVVENLCGGLEPYLCPNQKKCVSNRIKCITPPNDCDASKPFECLVNGVMTCVKSQLECDCPTGFIRCTDFMHYCVPEDRPDMCPFFLQSNKLCKANKGYIMFEDGICRASDSRGPSQPACPIGKVLCADLSCRDSYPECYVSPYCEGTEARCADQTCVTSAKNCPSIISCVEEGYVACPDGTCVENEAYCDPLPSCTDEAPYLCQGNSCADIQSHCPKFVACGDGKLLCEDFICRTTC